MINFSLSSRVELGALQRQSVEFGSQLISVSLSLNVLVSESVFDAVGVCDLLLHLDYDLIQLVNEMMFVSHSLLQFGSSGVHSLVLHV